MKSDIRTDNLTLTPAIEQYLATRIKSIAKLIDSDDESARGEILLVRTSDHHLHGLIFKAEINLHIAGWYGRAEASGSDLDTTINEMKEEIVRQLRSHKKKQKTLSNKEGKKVKDWLRGWF